MFLTMRYIDKVGDMLTGKKVAIVQSNYIPWKGYFDLISSVDEFIILDDVQYTKRDWRNRNYIKTPHGLQWLTIPVEVKGKYNQRIFETKVSDKTWADKHLKAISRNYRNAKCYELYLDILHEKYIQAKKETSLSAINNIFIKWICEILEIKTKLTWAMDYMIPPEFDKNKRLIDLCKAVGANNYISGPAARDYIDIELFNQNGVSVDFFTYSGYVQYNQLYEGFEHRVSVIDLILNTGNKAKLYYRGEIS